MATPRQEEFHRATKLAGDSSTGLRAGDALHLAIAEGLNAETILCFDPTLAQGARARGMTVVSVQAPSLYLLPP